VEQEGQHELTGQRAANFRQDLGASGRHRTLIDGYLESPFLTACLLQLKCGIKISPVGSLD